MGFFSSFTRSIRKSRRLAKLERIIAPPSSTEDVVAGFLDDLKNDFKNRKARDEALEEFFDLCEADPLVAQAMNAYGATRETLFDLHKDLIANGAGQWARGHFAALSALAYAPPLMYCLEARKNGENMRHVAFKVVDYFENGKFAF